MTERTYTQADLEQMATATVPEAVHTAFAPAWRAALAAQPRAFLRPGGCRLRLG